MAPMVFSEPSGNFLAVNNSFCELCGRNRDELLGRDSKHLVYPDDVSVTEEVYALLRSGEIDEHRYFTRLLHKNGRIVFVEVSMCTTRDDEGKLLFFVSSVRDITEERALAAQLSFQALHDPLTGLANRALFDDRLSQARSRNVREGKLGAILLVDLDDFKVVNDSFGHLIGDQLLVEAALRSKNVTRRTDTLCRFGGDEFLYLAESLSSREEASLVAQRLLGTLSEPFVYDDIHITQRASVGMVVWDDDSRDNTELVRNADVAMYEAKKQGRSRVSLFSPKMNQAADSRSALSQQLTTALSVGDMAMHFQPIVNLASNLIVGFEALMRWQHRERGSIAPEVFIPLAEQNDLILELNAFALRSAMATASTWTATEEFAGVPYVAVNLSARQFHDPGLVALILEELDHNHIAPERLILEVTENVAMLDVVKTSTIIEELSRLGIGIALDNFGTGYCSLSCLTTLNPKIVKIDQSFIVPKRDRRRTDTLLEAIVTLCNRLNMTVLAEGIETTAQLDRLHDIDCELGQGFLWSPAVSGSDASDLLVAARQRWVD